MGDFDDERSDIDLLAVTRELLGPGAERSIAQLHDSIVQRFPEWQDRLEVGYFPLAVVSDFEEPLGDVHRISPGEPFHRTPALPHWLTDLYSVQEHGHAISGPPSAEILPPASTSRFRATIQRLIADWREGVVGVREQRHQADVRLTMFRSLYAFQYARQTSKVAAAQWFSADFPEWSREAQEAVLWRQSDSTAIDLIGAKRTEDLVRFVYDRTRRWIPCRAPRRPPKGCWWSFFTTSHQHDPGYVPSSGRRHFPLPAAGSPWVADVLPF